MQALRHLTVTALCCTLMACATAKVKNPQDPYESFNRKVFGFNRVLDKTILRPVSQAYHSVLPNFVIRGVSNFFSNLDELPTIGNELLQLKFYNAWSDLWRFGINTTVGMGGLFDVSSEIGLNKHYEDLGLTLANYGYKNSNYLVIPFFGSGTVRDFIAAPVNFGLMTIYPEISPTSARYGLYMGNVISDRAQLLDVDHLVDEALDPYVFIRDAYFQKRKSQMMGTKTDDIDIYEQENSGR